MEQVLHGLDSVEVHLDDIGDYCNTWEEHQVLLHKIPSHLEANGFTINPLKYAWAIQETN